MRNPHEREALVAGMTLVPALLSRNRNFALFEDPEMRRVRVRAALLRGIVRQLAGAEGKVESLEVLPRSGAREGAREGAHQGAYQSGFELRYRLPGVRVSRRAVLTDLEYSCVAYLAGRASVAGLAADDEDRARIDTALRRLSAGLRLAEIDGGLGV
jgi:hypothetical protein